MHDIALKMHEEQTKCFKYILALRNMKLVDKVTTAGQKESSKKTLHQISANFSLFWYHGVFVNRSSYELLKGAAATQKIQDNPSR